VREVAAMNVLPLTPRNTSFAAAIEDHPVPPEQPQYVLWSTAVTPEHREVLGIRLLEGRGFTQADHGRSAPVVMISQSTARRFWPDRSAVGRRLKPVWDREWRTVVGVLSDVRSFGIAGLPEWVNGEVYVPMAQSIGRPSSISVVARVDGDPGGFARAIRGLVHEVCPTCAVSKVASMEQVAASAVEAPKSTAWLVGAFALLALGMAGAGIYGVVNHAVVRRTREMGVRMALGAGRGNVAALVVRSSLRGVLTGSLVGFAIAWALAKLIRSLLFGVAPHDPWSFAAGPVVLVLIALAASAPPAIRAAKIDPAQSLREG
jgi:hypothetical protein